MAKVSAEDERLGLFALDDGRGPSPDSATFSDGTVSIDEDGTLYLREFTPRYWNCADET